MTENEEVKNKSKGTIKEWTSDDGHVRPHDLLNVIEDDSVLVYFASDAGKKLVETVSNTVVKMIFEQSSPYAVEKNIVAAPRTKSLREMVEEMTKSPVALDCIDIMFRRLDPRDLPREECEALLQATENYEGLFPWRDVFAYKFGLPNWADFATEEWFGDTDYVPGDYQIGICYCPCKQLAPRRRMSTAYEDDKINFIIACDEAFKEIEEQWAEYKQGRL